MYPINRLLIILSLSFSSNLIAEQVIQYDQEDWGKWLKEYEQTIVGQGGWLSLAGLYWLTEGANSVGSAKDNSHQFPSKAPKYLGTIEVANETVRLVTTNKQVYINSKQITQAALSAKDKTLVTFGDYEFYLIQREIGFAIRLIDNASEKVKSFQGTRFIPYDQSWVVPAKLKLHEKPQIIKIPTVYGTTREDVSAGWLEFEIDGQKQKLQAVDYGKENLIFVMFSDASSGDTTDGAGRYIEVKWPDEDGLQFLLLAINFKF